VLPAYRREGSGPLLVCHPGGPGFDSRYFQDLAGLGELRTLVLVDPRGTGASELPADPHAYATSDYVADLEELREHLGVEELDLLGHSHGGVVAMAYAAAHPARVRKLVLASTLPRFQEPQQQAMQALMESRSEEPWYDDARAALEAEQAGEFETEDELAALVQRELPFYVARLGAAERAYLETLADERPNRDALKLFNEEIVESFDLRPELGRVEADTLVIAGELDFICGPVSAQEITDALPGADLAILPGVGHFVFVEARDSFRDAVEAFLSG
jgi:pimeloyl-ACP methyl ester carboxylesterase